MPEWQKIHPILKSVTDWNYYFRSAKQATEFEKATKFLINHINKTYEFGNEIAKSIVDC